MSRLVVRVPNWVGDLAMATPVLAAAAADPRWDEVHVVLRRHLEPLLRHAPFEVTLHPVASKRDEARLWRSLRADAALLLATSFRVAWDVFSARVPIRAGAATAGRRWLLTHSVVPATIEGRRAPTPTAHLHRDLAGLLGIAVPDVHPRLGVDPAARATLAAKLTAAGVTGAYLLVSPGAAFGAAKLWPVERFAAAMDQLSAETGRPAVVMGSPAEQALVEAVLAASDRGALSVPTDLAESVALVAGASLLVVGDSGPRWIAAAFDVPCVSVMGPNFPEQTASSLEHARIVRVEGLECAPCVRRRCPLGHHRCMRDLPVEAVVAAAREVLA